MALTLSDVPVVCDPAKPGLAERELLDPDEASGLERTFKLLANDSRLRMVHALARAGELCVSDLGQEVGMSPQAVSNQLQRLVDRSVVATRREGNRVYYRIADPCLPALLELAWCLTEEGGG
jgi:ArsR family transcriptional regulator, lead/cadmium/zinc/bismuth-responsive transcriptional repressor